LAVVSPQRDDAHARIEFGDLAEDFQAAIAGTIVDVNDFR
jgi:glycine cleavage system H lipoate-binding protein